MSKNLGRKNWPRLIFSGLVIVIFAGVLVTSITSLVRGAWPDWQSELLRIILIFLAALVGILLYEKFSGLGHFSEDKILELLKPGAKLRLNLKRDGWGILLAKYLLESDGLSIELTTISREVADHLSQTWSWAYGDDSIFFGVKEHVDPKVYGDLLRGLARKIYLGGQSFEPQKSSPEPQPDDMKIMV